MDVTLALLVAGCCLTVALTIGAVVLLKLGVIARYALKPEHEWVYTPVEPIVSVELWEQCNQLLDARSDGRTKL